jgi:anti-sigma B factor antagonist
VRVAEERLAGGVVRLMVEGRLDAVTVPAFEQTLQRLLAEGQFRFIVDLGAVSYISSSGLRALLTARRLARSRGGEVFLCQLHPRVREIFEMVGFLSVFSVYPTCQEAANAFPPLAPAA